MPQERPQKRQKDKKKKKPQSKVRQQKIKVRKADLRLKGRRAHRDEGRRTGRWVTLTGCMFLVVGGLDGPSVRAAAARYEGDAGSEQPGRNQNEAPGFRGLFQPEDALTKSPAPRNQ